MFPCRVAPATPDQVVEASLVMNLSPIPLPNNSTRRLMTQADLQTVLHEFGHVINQIFIGRGQPWQDLGVWSSLLLFPSTQPVCTLCGRSPACCS